MGRAPISPCLHCTQGEGFVVYSLGVAAFLVSLGLGLGLIPIAKRLGIRFGIVDKPSQRKVHKLPMPRVGGVAMMVAFVVPVVGVALFFPEITAACSSVSLPTLLGGALLVFFMGLIDDIRGLPARLKLVVQVVAACIAYAGGVRILQISLPWDSTLVLGWMSAPVTIFWILLVVNAVNLIDGLDGLAAGVALFASLVLVAASLLGGHPFVFVCFSAMVGTLVSFLRYNFNPATVFMGDAGSYFIGFLLAVLSVLGSVKSRATVAMVVPVLALGVPLMDTMLAPVRRFIVARGLFQPDKDHIHHRLLKMGLTQRGAVLVIYGLCAFFGFFGVLLVKVESNSGIMLLIVAGCAGYLIRKLGYFNYLGRDEALGYAQDVADELGLHPDRRAFLRRQVEIGEARNFDDLQLAVKGACEMIGIDSVELQSSACFFSYDGMARSVTDASFKETRGRVARHERESSSYSEEAETAGESQFFLLLPLLCPDGVCYGRLKLRMNTTGARLTPFTLKRVEHLRRSVVRKLREMGEAVSPEGERVSPVQVEPVWSAPGIGQKANGKCLSEKALSVALSPASRQGDSRHNSAVK